MNAVRKKLSVGFITYGKETSKYLPYFLSSLKNQTFKDFNVFAIDNTENEENENKSFILKNFPDIHYEWAGENLGYAKAYNLIISRVIESGADYFLALNPDIILDNDCIEKLIDEIENDEKIGAIAPKILRWDFVNNKRTTVIDSCGLGISENHCFYDLEQGKEDLSKNIKSQEIFGATGAAALFRISALNDVAYNTDRNQKEFFDELMFMYKEDCDLSYRLKLAGWKIIHLPSAVAYHDRTAYAKGRNILDIIKNRRNKTRKVKKWSYLNNWILLLKYENLPFSPKISAKTAIYQLKTFIYICLAEQYLILEIFKLWKIKKLIKKKTEKLKIRVNINEIEKFMQ